MHLIEEITYKQLQPYGCGLYSLANLFVNVGDTSIFSEERLEQSKKGNTTKQLINWLNHHNLFIEPYYFNSFGWDDKWFGKDNRLPGGNFYLQSADENHFTPILIEGRKDENKDSKYHIVSGLVNYKAEILVYDSLLVSPYWTTFDKIIKGEMFYHLRGILGFVDENAAWQDFIFNQ